MEILKDFKNDLLKRQEISLSLEADNNPNFNDIKKQVAEQFKKSEEVIDVYNIKGSFGSNEFKIDAYIYDSKEDLEKNRTKKSKDESQEKSAPAGVPPGTRTSEEVPSDEGKEGKKPGEAGEGSAPAEDKTEEAAPAGMASEEGKKAVEAPAGVPSEEGKEKQGEEESKE